MTSRFILAAAFTTILSTITHAELPPVPTESIAKKKELLFSDDFQGTETKKEWQKVVSTFAFENGVLKGTQTRDQNIPAADGKPAVTAHAAVHGLEIPTKDSVVEVRVQLAGASMVDVEFDDRKYTGSHYGHLCRAQLKLNGVTIIDEKDGSMRNDIYESERPGAKEERKKLLEGKSVTYPGTYEANKWYTLVVETVGDTIRVTVDGKPAAFLKSPGIAHETKSKIELGVAGKDGLFDDIKVWSAEPVK